MEQNENVGTPPVVEFDHVFKEYKRGNQSALQDITFSLRQGEFVFMIGPSGAGKSTVLKLILREELPTKGRVFVSLNDSEANAKKRRDTVHLRRRDVPRLRRQIGIVFQDFRLIPSMTVAENIAFPLHVTNVAPAVIRNRVRDVMEQVGIEGKGGMFPNYLSGGEQQRVALARALVHEPKLLIADEPTGNIDPERSEDIMRLLDKVNREKGVTTLVVSHDRILVQSFDHRIIRLQEGQIVLDEPPLYATQRFWEDGE